MALVTTTVTPTVTDIPFTGISEVERERSGIARSEVIFSAYGSWPATSSGDNRSISFLYSLDNDYGYVLMESNAAFISPGFLKMGATGVMEVTSDLGPGASDIASQWYPYVNHANQQDSTGNRAVGDIPAYAWNGLLPVTGGNSIMVFTLDPKPTGLLYPYSQRNTIDVVSMFGEEEDQEEAYAYRFFARYLKYDVVQGYNYVVNSPSLTR
jgi:hypothetical protein|tara:strand:+ start:17 stop:649 length:633 start_codon:yes stop_codon:yes gene_type:complete